MIRELAIPHRLFEMIIKVDEGPVDMMYLGAVRHTILQAAVLAVFRASEIRKGFLAGWLFTEDELTAMRFPPVEAFIGGAQSWKQFTILRHQYAGHATSREATRTSPAELIAPEVLGAVIREAGVADLKVFLTRVVDVLAPDVETVLAEVRRRYPEVDEFVRGTYPVALSKAREPRS